MPSPGALALLAALGCHCLAFAAECNGAATPGPRNLHPIDTAAPSFVRSVANGKLFSVGQGDDAKDLLHLYGTPYENGMAMGTLLGPKLISFFSEVYTYTEGQVIANLGNETWCRNHVIRCQGLREVRSRPLSPHFFAEFALTFCFEQVMHMGLNVALNLSYHQTAPYIKPYVLEELQGPSAFQFLSVLSGLFQQEHVEFTPDFCIFNAKSLNINLTLTGIADSTKGKVSLVDVRKFT